MTTFSVDINNENYFIQFLTYNITTKSYKIDTEILHFGKKTTFFCPSGPTNLSFIKCLLKNSAPTKIVSMYQTIWKIDTSLIEPKSNYSDSIWWQPGAFESWHPLQVNTIFLQGEHFITTVFGIPDGSPLQVRLRVVDNLLSKIVIPITVRPGELANFFVTLKISRTLDKRENQNLDDLFDSIDENLERFSEVSHIQVLHALVDLYDIWT